MLGVTYNKERTMQFGIQTTKHSTGKYLAVCPELDLCCYGKTKTDSESRLNRVIDFYIQSLSEIGVPLTEVIPQDESNNTKLSSVEILPPISPYNHSAFIQ